MSVDRDPSSAGSSVSPLVHPGSTVFFAPEAEGKAVAGTTIEVRDRSMKVVLTASGQQVIVPRCRGLLAVIDDLRRKVEVRAMAAPSGRMTEITPRPGPVVEAGAPRVPVFAPMEMHVRGRMGGPIHGQLLDLSMSSCTVLGEPGSGAVAGAGSKVVVACALLGRPVGFRGVVVSTSALRGRTAMRVDFAELDPEIRAATEQFLEQRHRQLASVGQAPDLAHVELAFDGATRRARLRVATAELDIDLPSGLSVRATMRLPGVAPVLTAAAVTERPDGTTRLRWTDVDPVTRVLLERPGSSQDEPDRGS